MGDESLRRGEHPLICGDETFGHALGLIRISEVGLQAGSDDRISDEAQERLDRTLSDVAHGHVRRAGQREQLGERKSGIKQRQPCAHRLRIGRRVARDPGRIDVVGQEQSGPGDRLEQRHARTDLRSERCEIEPCLEVVDWSAHRGGERGIRRVEGGGLVLHSTEDRPSSVGSLLEMSDRSDEPTTYGMREVLPAAGRDGKDAALVQAMFDRVAPRYDLANTVLSLGQDGHWRRVTAAAARPEGAHVLDVAAGPGNVAVELVRQGAEQVIALDLSFNMLWEGAKRGHVGIAWVNGDALALPFAAGTFDAVTISFGLRNVPDPEAALAEFARVTRPGGRVVVCEFADPTWGPFREVYRRYLIGALPQVARVVSSNAPAYQYLADSILAWPDRRTLAGWMDAAGFNEVRVRDLSGGIVAVHRGVRG